MLGLMQDYPLLVHTILDHAARNHGDREIVTRAVEGGIRRCTYADIHSRSRRVAKALEQEGIQQSDRVATMAWNTDRHLETWYGIMGMGAVCHTVNPRLFPEQIVYIINHAEDKILFVDLTFVPIIEQLQSQLPTLQKIIVLTDGAHMPEHSLENAVAYEDWLAGVDDDYQWCDMDENSAAALCYTSGTTGNPKGVLYSHRSNVLHSLMCGQSDVMGVKSSDVVLPVVPMFHANAWALAFAAPASGAKLVMPGSEMDGASIYELLHDEKVTISAAVPTVWFGLLQYLEATGKLLPHLKRVPIGGASCPRTVIEKFDKNYGVDVLHAWGMTEMSPIGTIFQPKAGYEALSDEEQLKLKMKQGRAPYLVEMKIVDEDNNELPWDGVAFGRLLVKGPAVSSSYYKNDSQPLDSDGWFDTGDVANIDPQGYMQITDRSKDVIKSGGEWISSIEIENVAVGHPAVAEAAVIGVHHPKWDERPLLLVVKAEGQSLEKEEVLAYLEGKIAKWWMPDEVLFIDEIPHTATGKISKKDLREQFKDFSYSA